MSTVNSAKYLRRGLYDGDSDGDGQHLTRDDSNVIKDQYIPAPKPSNDMEASQALT